MPKRNKSQKSYSCTPAVIIVAPAIKVAPDLPDILEFIADLQRCRKWERVFELPKKFQHMTISPHHGHYDIFYRGTLISKSVNPGKDYKDARRGFFATAKRLLWPFPDPTKQF
jgi:hypothetical protein